MDSSSQIDARSEASAVRLVEITDRCEGDDAAARPRPADAAQARDRLDDGCGAFATLLDDLTGDAGVARPLEHGVE
jgi:hypothetical protein